MSETKLPANPLERVKSDDAIQRRIVTGILESYNGNYDVLAELVQNAIDAIEDAYLLDLPGPYCVQVHVNLKDNSISVLDTGRGMNQEQAISAFAPNVSYKNDSSIMAKRGAKLSYRGYKGVGLTFLAYGTDDITLHTKTQEGELTKGRMQYARGWANSIRPEPAMMVEDESVSAIDQQSRGTYVRVQLSQQTRPKKLSAIASTLDAWTVILRTRTAIGQILLQQSTDTAIEVSLKLTDTDGKAVEKKVDPTFLFPHDVQRQPPFRFLNIPDYYLKHGERTTVPSDFSRQDGIYLTWDSSRIESSLPEKYKDQFKTEIETYKPVLYAFLPYQSSVWGEVNQILTSLKNTRHLSPGLVIAINRQRLADTFELIATRYEALSRNLFVVVHFENARPDQGRKTVQDEVLELAKRAADRVLQYIAEQRGFLKPQGDAPTPGQREVERNHEDWLFNVRQHEQQHPLYIPPITFASEPQNEQDVVGLFHQLSALGIFPGLRILATSQIKTYDSLVKYESDTDIPGLRYTSAELNPLGVSPYILGEKSKFETKHLTVEFKNNIDGLIDELDGDTAKDFGHIHICICWGQVADSFKGHEIEPITTGNLDERRYPGVTHLLRRDGQSHVIQVVMLRDIVTMIKTGSISLPDHNKLDKNFGG